MKHEVRGDLLDLANEGHFDVIIHGANCQNTMNSGVAAQLRERWPQVYQADTKFAIPVGEDRLGEWSSAVVQGKADHKFVVVNAYTQDRYGYDGGLYVNYNAINKIFLELADTYPVGTRFGYPYIGAGLGGGSWSRIANTINLAFAGFDPELDHHHTLVDFPSKKALRDAERAAAGE